MPIELINTGSELMLGRVLNTHQQWICRQMADAGYVVDRQVAISDDAGAITQAVQEALGRAELIITTGGLGPTSDDITRDHIAALLGRELREDPVTASRVSRFFESRGRTMPPSCRVQALIPAGATILQNEHGTAPGLAILVDPNPFAAHRAWLIMLPGPPRELKPMFSFQVLPLVQSIFGKPGFVCRTFRTTGLGESVVQERIAPAIDSLCRGGLEVGYCARVGEVDVRLSARGNGAELLVEAASAIVIKALDEKIFSEDDQSLEGIVVKMLQDRSLRLALAESCTGGLISHRLTNVPGVSQVFINGIVSYSNESKERLVGVHPATLTQFGAVSAEVAQEMAEGAKRSAQVDYALGVTGIAGPGGGTSEKPVGTVFLALAGPDSTTVIRFFNPYDRETFKFVTSQQALDLLRRRLLSDTLQR